ncbi:ribokinase [Desulfatibacillum aliphaticivorans]|uniref:Multifunctional fusion protein n=1 Tax=Desulfatibacillum aliphaticivorans TaxID=218208 RepID=B8FAM2_DESAL|nr:ribokinase [Desulfatibacillum aliphaticivorans]ACL03318.1 ribokinase [Desulfatibacillum aliphaticivorans]
MTGPKICVVGACNIDLISYVERLPVLGETLHGKKFSMGFGGKGANQAVMAAKLGGEVAMVGKLGRDVFGENTLANFKKLGVNVSHVHFTEEAFSGVAPIAVDDNGANSIIIVTGASDLLSAEEIRAAENAIAKSKVLVCQLEIPMEQNLEALRIARKNNVPTIFNPAPARPGLPDELYQLSDIFCPNESETEILTGMPVETMEQAEQAAKALLERGPKTVILTLGERGCLLVDANGARHIPTRKVEAIDTTGAGDCFVGSLAFFLAAGKSLEDAINRANKIAAVSVCGQGTQSSFPGASELDPEILSDIQPAESQAPAMSAKDLAQYIDHTLLKPEAPLSAFDKICEEAILHQFRSVCVNSCKISYIAKKLKGTGVDACAVIGFPLGAMSTAAKAFEAKQAVMDGAAELDMVINVGALKSGDFDAVFDDIKAVRDAAPLPIILKVIIETCLLTDEEKARACRIAKAADADFVKTSTGFSTGGATLEDIALMRDTVGPYMGVKASGGIKDAKTAIAMIEAGATRIGAGAGVEIVSGLQSDADGSY